ncbi:hypothetical protein ACHAWO_004170 [Cyclotella atomus]|uniref:RGS domain-containing protein n=1 Tax=Cyclotella atomus TaxID=382360 RepID=A0ABD3N7Z5_9STRA
MTLTTIILLILFPVYELGCYALLFFKRKELFFLKRNELAIFCASLSGWLAYFTIAASASNVIPCGVVFIASSLVSPLSVAPQLVRALLLRGKFESSKLVIEEEISSREQRKSRGLSTIPSGSEYKSGDEGNKSTAPSTLVAAKQESKPDQSIERARSAAGTTKLSLAVGLPILLILTWCISSIESGATLSSTSFEDCKTEPRYFSYAKLLFDIVSLILAILACVIVRHIDDELYLHHEITETAVLFIITTIIITSIRLAGHTAIQPFLQTIQQMILMCSMVIIPCCPEIKAFNNIQSWFKRRINPASKSAVPAYAQPLPLHRGSTARASIVNRQESNRLTIETNTSWDAGLCILLSSEEGITAFTRHCAREFSSENILFWGAVNDYRAKFDDNTRTITMGDDVEHDHWPTAEACERSIADEARDIYNRFIDNHSNSQVNLSSKQKNDILKAMESDSLTKDTFDIAQKEIFSVMSRDSYPRFLASKSSRRPL